jgi:hypothetical protein
MKNLRMIRAVMDSLPFVKWDKFIKAKSGAGTDRLTYVVYGWVVKDYGWVGGDFVVLYFKFNPYHLTFFTSCAERAKEIGYALFGDLYKHHPCRDIKDLK